MRVIHSFLVHPAKGLEDQPKIGGTEVPLNSRLGNHLSTQFYKASSECKVEIAFEPAKDGKQQNEFRKDLLSALQEPSLEKSRTIAARLQRVTTNRSGLGLFFITIETEDGLTRAYLSRYPADQGIVAEETDEELRVEFIEKVFMKNALAYKGVYYQGKNFDTGFWKGKAIDRQIDNNSVAISGYWISEFLKSDFETTSATGTRRLALAIKKTIDKCDDLEIKEELVSASTLAKTLNKKPITIENFWERFALSEKTKKAVMQNLSSPAFRFDNFIFSSNEFKKHVRFRSLSMNNGATLTAPIGRFDEVFQKIEHPEFNEVEFSTRGKITDDRLQKKGTR